MDDGGLKRYQFINEHSGQAFQVTLYMGEDILQVRDFEIELID